jgi:uncharacterized protein YndB with AHSA1/START domain
MSTPEPVVVRVTRRFAASAERVFDAWLDPERARRFLFATPAGEVVRVEIDARVGGGFVVVDRRAEGDARHFGTYLEIDRPRRLVFAFAVEEREPRPDRVTVEVAALDGGGCELTLTHEMKPEWAAWAGRTTEGWTTILDGLAAVVDG